MDNDNENDNGDSGVESKGDTCEVEELDTKIREPRNERDGNGWNVGKTPMDSRSTCKICCFISRPDVAPEQ